MTQNHNIERVGRSTYQNRAIQPLSLHELSMMHDIKTKKINEKSLMSGKTSARRLSTSKTISSRTSPTVVAPGSSPGLSPGCSPGFSPVPSVASSPCAGMVALATVAWEQKVVHDLWAWVSRKVRKNLILWF